MNSVNHFFKKLTVGIVTMALLAACSDGTVSQAPANPAESPPVAPTVKAFTVKDAKDPAAKEGKSATIDSNGSVFVTWEVTDAKSVEIVDSKGKSVAGSGSPSGKSLVEALTADEFFILTAEGSDGVKSQDKVTVTIRKKEVKIEVTATPETIKPGESSRLCWTVDDAAVKITVTAGDEEFYPGNTLPVPMSMDETSTSISVQKLMLAATSSDAITIPDAPELPADSYGDAPAADEGQSGCITVQPAETITYTVTAKDGDKPVGTAEKKIEVGAQEQINIVFTSSTYELDKPGEVYLSWEVTPQDVKVDIDHGVITGGIYKAVATKADVFETTTFTLTATRPNGQSQSESLTVTVKASSAVTAYLYTPSVFVGELALIVITPPAKDGKVSVLDPSGASAEISVNVNNDMIIVKNPKSGNYTVDVDGVRSNAVNVEVRPLESRVSGGWNGVGLQGLQLTVAGNSGTAFATLHGLTASGTVEVPYGKDDKGNVISLSTKLAKTLGVDPEYMSNFGPGYTVNAVTFSAASKRAYAAVTGGVVYSDNAGKSWSVLDPMPLYDNKGQYKNTAESHAGCFGVTRQGAKNVGGKSAKNPLVNVVDVCDVAIVADANGKEMLVVATDFGAFYYPDVNARITNCDKEATPKDTCKNKELAMKGGTKENVLFGKVINNVEVAKSGDQTVLVAAASDGVYVNAANGDPKAWQQVDKEGLSGAVNAVAVASGKIYAGTDKGLYVSGGLEAGSRFSWADSRNTDAPAIKAIAVDAADPAIVYVGTSKGLRVSRDCAGYFTDVAADVGEVRNIATASEGNRSAVVLTSNKGLFSSVGIVGKAGSCAATRPESTPTETPGSSSPGTVRPN